MNYNGKRIKIGVGIHDSSSALIPYIRGSKKPFILVSTGTWSVSLNPFSKTLLNEKELQQNCISYMRINGKAVKSSKLLLGNEYKHQITELSSHYNLPYDHHKTVKFNFDTYSNLEANFKNSFHWKYLENHNAPSKTILFHNTYEQAYHQLLIELVKLQVKNIEAAKGNDTRINRLFVDGGFSDNDVFIKLLSHYLRNMKLRSTNSSLGSALGAAIVISDSKLNSKFLKENYSLKKHVPFIIT
jgi:sugar (pentulose or hexulose) kinase